MAERTSPKTDVRRRAGSTAASREAPGSRTAPESKRRPLLAADLDGTLIPPDGSPERMAEIRLLREEVESARLSVAYVTGRHLELAVEGIERFALPRPAVLACDVGTSVFWHREGGFVPDTEYRDLVASTPGVARGSQVREALGDVAGLTLQEDARQAAFKVSYHVDRPFLADLLAEIRQKLAPLGRKRLVTSRDARTGQGLLDVLPELIGKGSAVRYLADRLEISDEEVVFAGDSGNDRDAILAGIRAIVVGNAPGELKGELRGEAATKGVARQVFFARSDFSLGVLEGLRHFGVLPVGKSEERS